LPTMPRPSTPTFCAVLIVAAVLMRVVPTWGYPVGPAVSLEKLSEEADLVFKGTAVAIEPGEDSWFERFPNYVTRETRFKVISVLKGAQPGDTLRFRHYDEDPNPQGCMFQPQIYHFEIGRSYIVFAKRHDRTGVFRQLWKHHTIKMDQGVLRCLDDRPAAATIKEALWTELKAMLASPRVTDAVYAIDQLDQMSAGKERFEGLSDVDRTEVLAVVRGLMTNGEFRIAQAAIRLVGSHNPYMADEQALFWLATVGSAEIPGIGKMDPKRKNLGGELCRADLVALADSNAPAATRAMAVRALGLVREPSLRKPLERWLTDADPAVRGSAVLLLADFPGAETRGRMGTLNDDSAEVRACVARAIGFGQQPELAEVLAKLLADREADVRRAAAMSLLSFSPKNDSIAKVFRANLDNEEFQPLFLNALARENPTDHLEALSKAVEEKTTPTNFWGGQIPAFTSWEILFRYLQAQPSDRVRSGELDRYLDALEKVGNYSSSEPRDIYAFYIQRGMTERAKRFRHAANQAASYDLDYYFKQVDENPTLYKRQ